MPKPTAPNTWQLQDAKARFSEVFRRARSAGPQRVTRQGKDAVVVISAEEFETLSRGTRKRLKLSEFFARSPFAKFGIKIERDLDPGRTIKL